MYDVFNGTPQWRVITVDDKIPVKHGTYDPLYVTCASVLSRAMAMCLVISIVVISVYTGA